MSFINPIWLYGLLGLLVPIAIHLWSKKEGKTIKVGSIQFFPESETRQSSKLHLNEIFLLILRSLIVALLVMLIAQPILITDKKKDRKTVLIEPALLRGDNLGSLLDTIQGGDYNIKLLTTGLPDLDIEGQQDYPNSNYWQLIQEIEELASNEVIVFAANRLTAFKGKVPASSKRLIWNTIPPKYNAQAVLKATIYKGKYNVIIGDFEEGQTGIERINFDNPNERTDLQFRNSNGVQEVKHDSQDNWITVKEVEPTLVSINYDQEFETDAQLMAAAFRAIQEINGIPCQIELVPISSNNQVLENRQILVWLTNKKMVDVNYDKALIYNDNIYEKELINSSNVDSQFWLNRRLSLANMSIDDLPENLVQTLFKDDELEQRIDRLDRRTIEVQFITPTVMAAGTNVRQEKLAIPHYYWIVFMALMALERFVSLQRKQ
jgi:hypothetical protein